LYKGGKFPQRLDVDNITVQLMTMGVWDLEYHSAKNYGLSLPMLGGKASIKCQARNGMEI